MSAMVRVLRGRARFCTSLLPSGGFVSRADGVRRRTLWLWPMTHTHDMLTAQLIQSRCITSARQRSEPRSRKASSGARLSAPRTANRGQQSGGRAGASPQLSPGKWNRSKGNSGNDSPPRCYSQVRFCLSAQPGGPGGPGGTRGSAGSSVCRPACAGDADPSQQHSGICSVTLACQRAASKPGTMQSQD